MGLKKLSQAALWCSCSVELIGRDWIPVVPIQLYGKCISLLLACIWNLKKRWCGHVGGLFNFQRWKARASESQSETNRGTELKWGNWVLTVKDSQSDTLKSRGWFKSPWLPLLCSLWAACAGRFEKPVSQVWTWVSVCSTSACILKTSMLLCCSLATHSMYYSTGLGQARPSIHSTNSYGVCKCLLSLQSLGFSSKKEI